MELFYFAGRAGDLPAALLRKAVDELREQNYKTGKLLKKYGYRR